jgi:CRISPR-associated protein Cas1
MKAAAEPLGVNLVIEMSQQKMENQLRFLKRLMHARPRKQELFAPAVSIIDRTRTDLDPKAAALEDTRNRIMGWKAPQDVPIFDAFIKYYPKNINLQVDPGDPPKICSMPF